MKQALIYKRVGYYYFFRLVVDGKCISTSDNHTDKKELITILKDHFREFEIVDNTLE